MWQRRTLPVILFAVGLIVMITGILGGEAAEVMIKSIRICFECIGIG
ncbi:MAG: thioredoxin [Peptococcaceae bacterium]|nr:thioredoxin [Peptococcaceae bacterium]